MSEQAKGVNLPSDFIDVELPSMKLVGEPCMASFISCANASETRFPEHPVSARADTLAPLTKPGRPRLTLKRVFCECLSGNQLTVILS